MTCEIDKSFVTYKGKKSEALYSKKKI